MSARVLIATSLSASLAIAGCGQTGPLHLPADAPSREGYLIGSNPNAKKKTAAEPAAPAPAAAVETPAEAPAPATP